MRCIKPGKLSCGKIHHICWEWLFFLLQPCTEVHSCLSRRSLGQSRGRSRSILPPHQQQKSIPGPCTSGIGLRAMPFPVLECEERCGAAERLCTSSDAFNLLTVCSCHEPAVKRGILGEGLPVGTHVGGIATIDAYVRISWAAEFKMHPSHGCCRIPEKVKRRSQKSHR